MSTLGLGETSPRWVTEGIVSSIDCAFYVLFATARKFVEHIQRRRVSTFQVVILTGSYGLSVDEMINTGSHYAILSAC